MSCAKPRASSSRARAGTRASSGSSPRGWSSATTGRWSSSRSTPRGTGAARGAAFPASICSRRCEACSEHLETFGGHRAAAGLALKAENLDAFRAAFAAHATEVLGAEDLKRTERIDAMVGGVGLGLELAEELGQLAPFGMGNPGVRLLVPSARVSDVRTMGRRASTPASASTAAPTGRSASPSAAPASASTRRTRSTPRCGSRSTTGTARSSRGWCCASSTRSTRPRAPRRPTPASAGRRSGGAASSASSARDLEQPNSSIRRAGHHAQAGRRRQLGRRWRSPSSSPAAPGCWRSAPTPRGGPRSPAAPPDSPASTAGRRCSPATAAAPNRSPPWLRAAPAASP